MDLANNNAANKSKGHFCYWQLTIVILTAE